MLNNRQTSNIKRNFVGNKLADHSDVVGASPVGRCSNYILILVLTPGFSGLGKDNYNTRGETLEFWVWMRLLSKDLA